jgi:nitroimidazol reductase NimA-like FMN-containing flavoprotein (pyridoxamine 5'-phosphate oxidase superfamily)
MRRKDKEIRDRNIIEQLLSGSDICRIAMIDGNRPYLVPLNYGYAGNTLYFHSASSGKKIDILKQNNRVCFEIENHNEIIRDEIPCEWTAKYRSLIGYGTIEFITGFEEKKKGLDVIMAHYGKTGTNNYKENNIENMIILKLKIEEISGKQSGHWDL